jgi:DNA adenine methylase
LRWHGGKWLLAPWIIRQFPEHQCYVEPFGAACSVLLRKARSYSEIYNDLDQVLVRLMSVLRDGDLAPRLIRQLELTPFAREEFNLAYEACDDPVENARRTVVRSFMGFGSDSTAGHYRTGFRSNTTQMGTTPARDWDNYPDALRAVVDRLRGVTIESKPAAQIMTQYDSADTLHYVDPPYHPETRSSGNRRRVGPGSAPWQVYKHELDHDGHVELLEILLSLRGMVALSGYATALYDDALAGWKRLERSAYADGAAPRTEVLWLNPALVERLSDGPLFTTIAA